MMEDVQVTKEQEAEFFAKAFTGDNVGPKIQYLSLQCTLNGMIAVSALKIALKDHRDQREEVIEHIIACWREAAMAEAGKELRLLKSMQESPLGQIFGQLMPDLGREQDKLLKVMDHIEAAYRTSLKFDEEEDESL